jgi:hypothetical protein
VQLRDDNVKLEAAKACYAAAHYALNVWDVGDFDSELLPGSTDSNVATAASDWDRINDVAAAVRTSLEAFVRTQPDTAIAPDPATPVVAGGHRHGEAVAAAARAADHLSSSLQDASGGPQVSPQLLAADWQAFATANFGPMDVGDDESMSSSP